MISRTKTEVPRRHIHDCNDIAGICAIVENKSFHEPFNFQQAVQPFCCKASTIGRLPQTWSTATAANETNSLKV
jgi:hypothetical protein